MRKAILFLLAFALSFSVAIGANKYEYRIQPQGDADIVKLTMCADDCKEECRNLLLSFGHAFFMLENISDSPIALYGYTVAPGEMVTFSWWAVDKHMGVWFNIESNYINIVGRYKNVECVSTYLDSEELEMLNKYVEEKDYYTPLSNCSKQVISCWNTFAEDSERIQRFSIATPGKLKEQILSFSENCRQLIALNPNIAYYNGTDLVLYEMKCD